MFDYVEVYTRSDGKYDFRVIAGENGKTLANSDQGYNSKSAAWNTIFRVTGRLPYHTTMEHKADQRDGYINVVEV